MKKPSDLSTRQTSFAIGEVQSAELTDELAALGAKVDHLIPPNLQGLAMALQAERERRRTALAEIERQMYAARAEATSEFTQLMLCAREDLAVSQPSYFESVKQLRKLPHE